MSETAATKATHTPGPWKVIPPGHGHPSDYQCVQIGADEAYTTLEMLPADAHLIAAAPDLLAALIEIVASTNRASRGECCQTSNFDAARAAIAKATQA